MIYNYTTADLIKNELRSTTDFSATTNPTVDTVTNWIQEESAQINKDSARNWGETEYTDVVDYNGAETITLVNSPVIAVSSVKYSEYALGTTDYSLTTEKVADTDYTVYADRAEIVILPSWSPAEGRKRISVTYTAGFETLPLTIQQLATKMVSLRVLNSLLNNNVNESNDGGSISVGSFCIVEPASYGVNSYQNLKKDIDSLKQDISKGFGMHRYTNYYR